jgi:hypothetical protein
MTWKVRVTPAGRTIYALRASVRRTSGNGCGSWPSPRQSDTNGPGEHGEGGKDLRTAVQLTFSGWPTSATQNAEGGANPSKENNGGFFTLQTAAGLASWATPRGEDVECAGAHRGIADGLSSQANLAPWSTPTEKDFTDRGYQNQRDGSIQLTLPGKAQLAPWGTPRSNNANGAGNPDRTGGPNGRIEDQAQLTASGATPNGSPALTARRGQLNPALSRWLMGLTGIIDDLAPYSKEWATVQRKLSEYSGDQEAFSHWLVKIGLADCGVTETP